MRRWNSSTAMTASGVWGKIQYLADAGSGGVLVDLLAVGDPVAAHQFAGVHPGGPSLRYSIRTKFAVFH